MEIFMSILVVTAFIAVFVLATLIILDKVLMTERLKKAHAGMTGHQFQNETKCKLKVFSVENPFYYAKVVSPLKFFKYTVVFKNGRLKEINRM